MARTSRARWLSLSIALPALVWATPAWAGDPAVAEALFDEAKRLLGEGAVAEACEKLAASWEEEASVGTMLNLARCNEKLGKTATAWGQYLEAAKLADKLNDGRRADIARDHGRELEGKLSHITIVAPSPAAGMQVRLNGSSIQEAALGIAFAVDPGSQRITVSAPGKRTWTTDVVVAPHSDERVVLPALLPEEIAVAKPGQPTPKPIVAPDPAPQLDGADSTGGFGALGYAGVALAVVGVGGVATGIALGALAGSDKDAALGECPNQACNAAGYDSIESARAKAHVSTAGFAIGGAALAAGVVMIVLAVTTDDEPTADSGFVTPVCSFHGCSLTVGGAF